MLLDLILLLLIIALRSCKFSIFFTVSYNIFCYSFDIPDIYSSKDADAVFKSTPTLFTQSSTTPVSASVISFGSYRVGIDLHQLTLGSIFTIQLSGSCNLLAMDTALL